MIANENITMGPWGTWVAGEHSFHSKRDALIFASRTNVPKVEFRWYDQVWAGYDTKNLGRIDLDALYLQRAQQLRDTYDHLCLYYSGGADSHNILMTFINNGIKLDQVYVNWPMQAVKGRYYTPNTEDTSASNILSEWDFAIEPTLKWLAQTHPEIVIEVGDWSSLLDEKYYQDDRFLSSPLWWGVGSLPRNLNGSQLAQEHLDRGRRVASVYGFDKPTLAMAEDQRVYMFFHDTAFLTASNTVGEFEPFYWSPALPALSYEMAYQLFRYFDDRPQERMYLRRRPTLKNIEEINEHNNEATRRVCYARTWPQGRFQAGKPWDGRRTDRDRWIYNRPEYARIVNAWNYNYSGFLQEISPRFLNRHGALNPIRTRGFYLGTLRS